MTGWRQGAPRRSSEAGFTLIELLTVIIIMGVLAAVAVPVYLGQRKKAVDASLKVDLKSAAAAAEALSAEAPSALSFGATNAAVKVAFAAAGFVATTGNTVQVSGSPAEGFCLGAFSPNGTNTAGGYVYDSTNGGLHPTRESYASQPPSSPCHLPKANIN